jgi:hypothetical protein
MTTGRLRRCHLLEIICLFVALLFMNCTRGDLKPLEQSSIEVYAIRSADTTKAQVAFYLGRFDVRVRSDTTMFQPVPDQRHLNKRLAHFGFAAPSIDFKENLVGLILMPDAQPSREIQSIIFHNGEFYMTFYGESFPMVLTSDGGLKKEPPQPILAVAVVPKALLQPGDSTGIPH